MAKKKIKIKKKNPAASLIKKVRKSYQTGGVIGGETAGAIDPKTGKLINNNIELETKMVMNNLNAILSKANMNFSNVVKTTIYIANMDDFKLINKVYGEYFKSTSPPARATVQIARLPEHANVEISMIAVK